MNVKIAIFFNRMVPELNSQCNLPDLNLKRFDFLCKLKKKKKI